MTSHPRPQRPAATDYFNPAEQLELLQNIKAKVEKSATATPQEHNVPLADKSQYAGSNSMGMLKPLDLVAHEVSLRDKLEKAKAEREAKAKAAAQGIVQQPQSTPANANANASQILLNGSKSTEPTAGPPPPPVLNNSNYTPTNPIPTPTPPTYGSAWVQSLGYPQQTPPIGYPRPPFPQYPQTAFAGQYGMSQYTNGQGMFPQWSQFGTTPTPGIPPAPQQQNQGPTGQSPPNQQAFGNQGSVDQSQSPPNPNLMGSMPPAQTDPRFRTGMAPQFGPPPAFPQGQQPQQQPGIPPRPALPQPSQTEPVPPQQQTNPAIRPLPPNQQNQTGPPTRSPGEVSAASATPKGPAGSMYNANPPAQRGPPNMPPSTDNRGPRSIQSINGSKPPATNNPVPVPPRPESPRRGPPISPLYDLRPYDHSPEYRRPPPAASPHDYQPQRDSYPPSPRMQHSSRFSSDLPYPPNRDHPLPARNTFTGRITTPPSRVSYRDRSRSRSPPRRESSVGYRPRPVIPEEGYKRENWDPSRGGYRNTSPPPNYAADYRRSYAPSPPPPVRREISPPLRYPPRRDLDDLYYRNGPPPPSRPFPPHPDEYHRPQPALRPRSRSPPYPRARPPSPPLREYPGPPPPGRGYYEPPPYPVRVGYARYPSPGPPGPALFDRRRDYDDYFPSPQAAPPVSFQPDERGYPPPPTRDGFSGYREDFRERGEVRPPPRAYSPVRPARGRGRGRGRY